MNESYEVIRNHAALVDVSHHIRVEIKGEEAEKMMNYAVGANLEELYEGRMTNTLMAASDGSLVAIIWLVRFAEHFLVIGDVEDQERIFTHLSDIAINFDVTISDITIDTFDIGVMGPDAESAVAEIYSDDVYTVAFQSWEKFDDVIALRYGMIGEYEIHFIAPIALKDQVLTKLLSGTSTATIKQVDDGDYPVLLTEMRNIHRGLHMREGNTIFQAGIHWMIDFRKEEFNGREALEVQKEQGCDQGILLVISSDNHVTGAELIIDKKVCGRIVCDYFSPTLGKRIAYAYVDQQFAWPGITYSVGESGYGEAVSAPAFLTRSVLNTIS